MSEPIKSVLTDLMSAIQAGKIYTTTHPRYKDFIEKAYSSLQNLLKSQKELAVGILDNEIASENEIFFDLSQKLKPLILYLKKRNIQRITFHRGVSQKELSQFISFLLSPVQDTPMDSAESWARWGIRNIKTGKIKAPSSTQKEMKAPGTLFEYYENSLYFISQYVESITEGKEIDYMELKFNALNFIENLVGQYHQLLNLDRTVENEMFAHMLNVCVLSMHVSIRAGAEREEAVEVGIAALFHDIGKMSFASERLSNHSEVPGDESARQENHPVLGAKALLNYKDTLGILPAVVAFEHHLRYDLKESSPLSFPYPPHPVSQIVSLCNTYDHQAYPQSPQHYTPPDEVYHHMMKEKGGAFHPQLIEKFFQIMGVWPLGTLVSLSDRRIAVVRGINEQDVFSPKVEVISPSEEKTFIDLSQTKNIRVERALNPLKEGKKYTHLL